MIDVKRLTPGEIVFLAFVFFAMVLGGGGSPAPLPEMLLEWMALAALVAVAWLRSAERPWPKLALAVAAVTLLLPILQLIPLPPEVWQALPGRESERAALGVLGQADRWMPWSMTPSRTLSSLLSLLPFVAAIVLAAQASSRGRTAALLVVTVVALLSVFLGAAQLASGPHSIFRFYSASHAGYLTGFQANRNAAADVLIIGLIALVALYLSRLKQWGSESRLFIGVGAALLIGGTLLTGSRAGIALLAVVLGVLALAWTLSLWGRGRQRLVAGLIGGCVLIAGLVAWGLAGNTVVTRIASRFSERGDPRFELWTDTLYAIGNLWPWGAGMGSFVPVFVAAERLEVVDSSYPNRAHNDYLEFALEAGLPGLVLLGALILLLIWRLSVALRNSKSPEARGHLGFATAMLFILAAHSLVDYPLRSMALATLAGVAIGFILAPDRPGPQQRAVRRETGRE